MNPALILCLPFALLILAAFKEVFFRSVSAPTDSRAVSCTTVARQSVGEVPDGATKRDALGGHDPLLRGLAAERASNQLRSVGADMHQTGRIKFA